jgi:predicted GIY-YIG superfamily endonuclease
VKYTFRLYVVALDDAVRSVGAFARENKGKVGPCLYVGSTANTPEHRFAQHKAGRFSNRGWVERFGLSLAPHLSDGREYQTRESAEQAERALAASLRREGYAVWQR